MSFARVLIFALAAATLCPSHSALAAESLVQRNLRQIVERQQTLFKRAESAGENFDEENFQSQLQQLCREYDALLSASPDFAPTYVAYGLLLGKVGMRKESVRLMLKANQLDKDNPLVKNQLGNYLAEDGKPVEAASYFLAAIQLDPKEPLYHSQLGTLLVEARDDFLATPQWTRAKLDDAMHREFELAMNLAPDDWRLSYRYGLSFYDLETGEWEAALQFWSAYEQRLKPGVEQQVCRLHQAKALVELRRFDEAKSRLDAVTEPALAAQKEKVTAEFVAAKIKAADNAPTPTSAPVPSTPTPTPAPATASAPAPEQTTAP